MGFSVSVDISELAALGNLSEIVFKRVWSIILKIATKGSHLLKNLFYEKVS